jgi:LysM repeat protein
MHRYLSRSIRLSITMVLSGAVLTSAFALPAAAAVPGSKAYVVRAGDTLEGIASKQGLESWRPIYDANSVIKHPDLIYPGQRLAIPPKGAKLTHRSLPTPQPVQVAQWRPAKRSESRSHRSPGFTSSPRSSSRSEPVAGGSVWDRLAQCESGGNWGISTGNGFYGGLQFTQGSWRAAGGSGSPNQASRSEQIRVAQNLQRQQGWGAWPTCSAKLGLR